MTAPSAAPGEPSAPASPTPALPVPPSEAQESGPSTTRRFLWQGKLTPAFWTIACILSLAVNIILFVFLVILGTQIFNVLFMV